MPIRPKGATVAALPFHLLELNVISAQDLHAVTRGMHTYAVAWVHPGTKLSTRVDHEGHTSPTWNDKFVFRIDDDFLRSETSAVMVEIYCVKFFRDAHVGTVRVLLSNLLPLNGPSSATPRHVPNRFVALQVRRPSGRPQGILNIGVALLDGSMRSMPLYTQLSTSAVGYRTLMGEPNRDSGRHSNRYQSSQAQQQFNAVAHLRRTKSDLFSDLGEDRPPFSTIETSELEKPTALSDSEIGPSPSVIAAKIAVELRKVQEAAAVAAAAASAGVDSEAGSSVMVDDWSVPGAVGGGKEDLKQKLERWRAELPPVYDRAGYESFRSEATASGQDRRKTEGGGGLFSCFGDSYGCECSIMCGLNPRKKRTETGSASKMHLIASDPSMARKYG